MEFWTKVSDTVLHYETYKVLDIKSKWIGLVYRAMQITVLVFAIVAIFYRKGYQETDVGISTLRIRVEGTGAITSKSNEVLYNKSLVVYDPADYIIPPNQDHSFFVMTTRIVTPNQTQGKCPEDPKFAKNWCDTDNDCKPAFEMVKLGNGIRTGACVKSDRNSTIKVCEIYGWCPTQDEDQLKIDPNLRKNSKEQPYLQGVQNFTVYIKNLVRFSKFEVVLKNIISNSYLRDCGYTQDNKDNWCPIFKLGDIIEFSGDRFEDVALKGATYGIIISWDCNLDQGPEECHPTYNFKRFHGNHEAPEGYKFHYADYYEHNGVRHRVLTKAFGIKFQVLIQAKAGKFAIESLFVALGASIANLAICKVVCDILVLRCGPKKTAYSQMKIQETKVRGKSAVSMNGTTEERSGAISLTDI